MENFHTKGDSNGITVNALNLSSSVGHEGKDKLVILDNLNFYLKPGTLTLLLGSPGCGKTSLFRVLSNQLHGENVTGTLLFNGDYINPVNHHKKISYVNQEDYHMASLTVRQTLQFSADCQINKCKEERNKKVDQVIELLDLEKHQDTLVGNEFLRGISGGQKKRVTIGVEIVKDNSEIFLMDEISTGLDSTTTFEIIKKLKKLATEENKTFLVSLLQPGVEVTNLFDNLLILAQGKMAYFGPLEDGIGYFESYGFKLPLHHNPSEFFQEIIDEPELYYNHQDPVPLKGASDFSNAFLNSEHYQNLVTELNTLSNISTPCPVSTTANGVGIIESPYYISHFRQSYLTSLRAFRMLSRNPIAIYIRIIKSVVVGLMLGSLYYGLETNYTDGNNRFNLLFYSLLFIVFGGMGSISVFFDQRDVYYSQKDRKYYHPFAYFCSLTALEIPLSALEAILYSTLVYWMCGLNPNGWKFIYFLLIIFVSNIFSNTFFKMVSSFSPNFFISSLAAPMLIAPFILFCGFLMPKPSIKGWWIWMYWAVPTKYMFEGLMSNEYHNVKYSCTENELLPPMNDRLLYLNYSDGGYGGARSCPYNSGDEYLKHFGMPQNGWFKWVDLLISISYTFAVLFLLYFFLKRVHYDSRLMKKENIDNRKKRIEQQKKNSNKEIKSKQIKEVDLSILNQTNSTINESGSYLKWDNIYYEVQVKRNDGKKEKVQLLKGINGYVKPGMLLALMGPSGAGKSTLLDVLSDRKTGGKMKGEITIDGKPKGNSFTRISAYVEQFDILPPTQTVRDAIMFSALLRLSSKMSKESKIQFVEYVIDMLSLRKIENKIIGSGESGLSISQRKRVNIGIELASDPQLLFLDEPTSGLDSSSALKVMNLIKKIASSGRSVICTIHQPSTTIFKKFDHLLLLKKGGETVYFGPTGESSQTLLDYFSRFNLICDPLTNPADFILDVTNNDKFDAVSSFKESDIYSSMIQVIKNKELINTSRLIEDGEKYSSSSNIQFTNLLVRHWKGQIRRPFTLGVRLGMSLMLGIVLGTFFVRMDTSQKNIFNRMSLLFFGLVFSGMTGMSFIPVVTTERGVFYREKVSGIYRVWVFVASFLLTDLPWILISSILLSVPAYFISGLYLTEHGSSFFYYNFVLFTTFLNYQLLAILLAIVLPNDEISNAFAGICLAISCLFAGFMIPLGSIAKGWKWFCYLDFVKYPLEMIMVNEFKHLTFECPNNKDAVEIKVPFENKYFSKFYCPIQDGKDVLQQFEMDQDNLYKNIPIIFSFSIIFIFFIFIGLKYIKYQVK
ncbi:hypothetical protein DICPUDRAFT_76201 [Dictyostelium purpureum]|uniref:ABC transporter domain-containing protein n=1 Tax=Dictyostelium purpureum TaxID=5786 RepID=F0ZCW9_DICPU|nr:uncharacterized protein DICPUDRAFT_76201 [Dictyostelium purpureum]EGC38233.1 hypothetical protein DICPUDRAFT_76201 [Dictyostelium purpureum]|eukprot:XP_003285271.1 hypothetical protein DICPUDRAFT_76201 [Dictyostelium purpureum]